MKASKTRVALGVVALVACSVVVWRLASSSLTTHRWKESFASGKAHLEEGSYSEAVSDLEIALFKMREIGPEHPGYDDTLDLLASAYAATGRYEDAYPLYLESLQRARAAHGADSPEVAQNLFHLARLRHVQGEIEPALGAYRQAITVWQNAVGNEHPDLVPTLIGLAETSALVEEYPEAAAYFEWAIGLQRRTLGAEHPAMAPLELAYADVLRKLQRNELADRFEAHANELVAAAEPTPLDPDPAPTVPSEQTQAAPTQETGPTPAEDETPGTEVAPES